MNVYVLIATEYCNDSSDFYIIKAFTSEDKAQVHLNELLRIKNDFTLNINQIVNYNKALNESIKFKVNLTNYIDENTVKSTDDLIESVNNHIEKLKLDNDKLVKEFELMANSKNIIISNVYFDVKKVSLVE